MEVDSDIQTRQAKVLKEEAYNTQLFGFTSAEFVQKVKDAFEGKCTELLECLECQLIEADESKKATVRGIKEFKSHLFRRHALSLTKEEIKKFKISPDHIGKIDKIFEMFEVFTKFRYFHVPKHILLPEDACHSTVMQSDATLASNKKLFRAVLQEKQLEVHLNDKKEELEAVKDQLEKLKEKIRQIERQGSH